MRRFGILIWKEFRQLRNGPISVRLIIVPVLARMLVLGYAVTTEVRRRLDAGQARVGIVILPALHRR